MCVCCITLNGQFTAHLSGDYPVSEINQQTAIKFLTEMKLKNFY